MLSSGPRFSVFTPSHNPRWLDECYRSLTQQSVKDWEWVVVLNGEADWSPPDSEGLVKVIRAGRNMGVGEAKRLACEWAGGEILVELDHDDILLPGALSRIGRAFDQNSSAVFAYSHWAQINGDGSPDLTEFAAESGWEYATWEYLGLPMKHALALESTPHNVSYIWYAPNHVRSFRRSAYMRVGGYDSSLHILDDQDLMARLYELGEFIRIDECLYLQRMHDGNTHRDREVNAQIQVGTVQMYDRYFERAALAWARRSGLDALEARRDNVATAGYRTLFDATEPSSHTWDLSHIPDGSVGVIRAQETLPLTADPASLMNELYRVLAPGGVLITITPSSEGRGGFQDPLARSAWNENSFWYYTEDVYRKRVPGLAARFQISRSVTTFPSEWHKIREVSYAFVNLIAIKSGVPRNGGPLLASQPES
ncbi:glycosyltransferase [Microbacterium testaceum]|uniref:glycosyltransferase n=1 Tax=Microbacterium testaceum TaxID=2033 RepID=UPI002AC6E064|nr:glycosyltransferase [Microbacterium testaceum]MDZ5145656.1 glycosyltransferase [Microbacterium testaceum]